MLTAKQADRKYNASPIKWNNFLDEVKELLVEIKNLDVDAITDELGDVFYFGTCALYYSTYINLPIVMGKRSVNKIEARFKEWEKIFNKHGLYFDKKYLVNGANYLKETKVNAALFLALLDQLDDFK